MNKEVACSVLRLVAIVSVLVGVVWTLQALVVWGGMTRHMAAVVGTGGLTVFSSAVPIPVGVLLFRLSPALASRVVG